MLSGVFGCSECHLTRDLVLLTLQALSMSIIVTNLVLCSLPTRLAVDVIKVLACGVSHFLLHSVCMRYNLAKLNNMAPLAHTIQLMVPRTQNKHNANFRPFAFVFPLFVHLS
jgi:hypothetical protein